LATTPQRSYTAPCPGCGAPVEFRSAQSTHAVCSFCHSTVVRDGDTLARIGKVAERFEDFSPLQLLARGTWQGHAFTLVGRLQYRGPDGAWTEWNCLFDAGPEAANGGTLAWLAEDNGGYVLAFPVTPGRELPEAARFRIGAVTAISGKSWQVTSNEQVALVAAEGELPKLPPLAAPFAMVELRSDDNEVLSLDYGEQPPTVSKGRPISLDELQFTGLKAGSEQAAKGRQFACPHCGAPVEPQFADSKAITCRSCHALIDLTQGIGGELRHALQDEPIEPLIPLGSTGQLQGAEWQVVGYQHRVGTEPGDDDEQFGWDEYLLYNAKRGFCFLVDASDGWSLVKTTTGAPLVGKDMQSAVYLGTAYRHKEAYKAETTYVAGEFYWPVERGQLTFNRDYARGSSLLSMEENPRERIWSAGSAIASDTVAEAFGLAAKKDLFHRGDAGPLTPKGSGIGCGCGTIVLGVLLLVFLLLVLRACEDGTGRSYTSPSSGTRSGSSGGWSSGGSHK
jgi:endogenous inhibitor of DNA gyrase (YacG/DUF329 family)